MKRRIILGMLLFVASESIFFALLALAYVNFHKQSGAEANALLDPLKMVAYSIALWSSSFTYWLAERSRSKESKWVRFWLLVTIVLGITFLTGEMLEYRELIARNITISRDLFTSTYFTLTGFHGLHVCVGLILLSLLLGLAFFGRKEEPKPVAMQAISVYWHFVDAVWVVIFSVVYLWRYI